jgi:hypothetical protein
MSGRAARILGRLPAHLEAGTPGKLLGAAAGALVAPLDALAAETGAVRKAHRPGQASELRDLLLIAARHGLRAGELVILFRRMDGAGHAALVAALRARLRRTIAIHRRGNGTVRALLEGAAAALGLELGEIEHSADRFRHAAFAREGLPLPPSGEDGEDTARPLVLGLEENPLHGERREQPAPPHACRFDVARRGFGPVHLRLRLTGAERGRTVAPRLVNRDQGRGIGFAGTVPAGSVLEIDETGRALLDGADVTSFAWSWEGACFAERRPPGPAPGRERDFVFGGPGLDPRLAGRVARFAVASPAGALDPEHAFPSDAGASLPPLGLGVGTTRFAFFVQEAHFSSRSGTAAPLAVRRVPPRPAVGFFDGSVFAAPRGGEPAAAAALELSWREHEAYVVRLLVPRRFAALAADEARAAAAVAAAVERFRPAGVELRVGFLDEHLIVDESLLPGGEDLGPLDYLRPGTLLAARPVI